MTEHNGNLGGCFLREWRSTCSSAVGSHRRMVEASPGQNKRAPLYSASGSATRPVTFIAEHYECMRLQLRTLSLRIPILVNSWQSYSSTLWRLWHDVKYSREASVINGQLSNSKTVRFSAAQGERHRCLMPSSVMSSQCDSVWKRTVSEWKHGCTDVNIHYQIFYSGTTHCEVYQRGVRYEDTFVQVHFLQISTAL